MSQPNVAVTKSHSLGGSTGATTTSQSRLKLAHKQLKDEHRQLLEVTRLITSLQEPQELFDTLIHAAVVLTKANRGFLYLRSTLPASPEDTLSGLKEMAVYRAPSLLGSVDPKPSRSAIGESLATGKTVLRQNEARPSHSMQKIGVEAVLVEPLLLHGHILGVLYLDSEENGCFKKRHVKMLPTFAAQAAVCLENLRLVTEREMALRRHYAEEARARELQAVQETMKSFMRMASTDLKGPLTVLTTGMAILKKRKDLDPQLLQDLEESLGRATRVVSEYLDMQSLKDRYWQQR